MAPSAVAEIRIKREEEDDEEDKGEDDEESHVQDPELPELTTVNGIGMWNQWTRNFKTPLLALLDLLDNAFDAAGAPVVAHHGEPVAYSVAVAQQQPFQGRLHVFADVMKNNQGSASTTGLVILNNSPMYIKPMAQVLQVYQSSKGNACESIGENGVGLKQGCATLSDLSLVLSKNLQMYSIGIISRQLQRDDGCSLPNFTFPSLPTAVELNHFFRQEHAIVGQCIREYGRGSLNVGVERLLSHFQRMHDMGSRAFCVILHRLKHGRKDSDHDDDDSSNDDNDNRNLHAEIAVVNLMTQLQRELPRQYIHVPKSLNVVVNQVESGFSYWQQRLVELTVFQIKMDPRHPIGELDDWRNPIEGYNLRLFAGFDPIRLEQSSKSPVSLFIYSRQSGRLIKHEEDARNVLGLSSGGTHFCQGLTIIVDDVHGNLPLNPTKQDLAFGEEARGDVHSQNLWKWVAGHTKLYYEFHLSKFPKKQKKLLTKEVTRHYPAMTAVPWTISRPLPDCHLSEFQNVEWVLRPKPPPGSIYALKASFQHVKGQDTLYVIKAPPATVEHALLLANHHPVVHAAAAPPLDDDSVNVVLSKRKRKYRKVVVTDINDGDNDSNMDKKRPAVTSRPQQGNNDDSETEDNVATLRANFARLELERAMLRRGIKMMWKEKKTLTKENISLVRKLDEHEGELEGLRIQVSESQERTTSLERELMKRAQEIKKLKRDIRLSREETNWQMSIAKKQKRKYSVLERQLKESGMT